tara:strand:- start:321 stop:602 length:282 start_codon:yes stop_codon:yes gene_type:complete
MSHKYPENFKYGIINSSDLSKIKLNQGIYPTSIKDFRYSLDESQFVIKWKEDHTPECIENEELVPVSILNWNDCHVLMQTLAWTDPNILLREV